MGRRSRNNTVLSNEQASLLNGGASKDEAAEVLEKIREFASEGKFSDGQEIIGDNPWVTDLVEVDPVLNKEQIDELIGESLSDQVAAAAGSAAAAAESAYEALESAAEDRGILETLNPVAMATTAREVKEAVVEGVLEEAQLRDETERLTRGSQTLEVKKDLLAARFRFAEQCYLIHHMDGLAQMHQASQTKETETVLPHYKYNKTHLLSGAGSTLLNKLRARPGSESLMDAMPWELSGLMPAIKLYKVVYDGDPTDDGKKDYEIPIKFLSHTLTEKVAGEELIGNILQPASGRTGVGIKSFDWEFISTNPDTIRNDIKAKLVLFFQSFDDLVARRKGFIDGEAQGEYSYLDLIIHPKREQSKATTEDDTSDSLPCGQAQREFDSSFFEIRATVGWNSEVNGISDEMKSSVAFNQTSLYLTLLDHSFNIEQDGTFTLTIEYRGRLDGMLSSHKSNILLTGGGPGAFGNAAWTELVEINVEMAQLKAKGGSICQDKSTLKESLKSLKEKKIRLEDQLRVASYKRFADDLLNPENYYDRYPFVPGDSGVRPTPLLYSVPVTRDEIRAFADTGTDPGDKKELTISSAEETDIMGGMKAGIEEDTTALPGALTTWLPDLFGTYEAAGGEFNTKLKDYSLLEEFDPRTSMLKGADGTSSALLQFFFLGDLIDIVATIVLNNTKAKVRAHTARAGAPAGPLGEFVNKYCFSESEVKNLRILLGPLEYRPSSDPSTTLRINIGDIPISWRMFVDFCHRKIIKPRKQTYSFIAFIRDMVKDLAVRALGAECFGEQGSKGVRMRVGFLEGPRHGRGRRSNSRESD